ncbi:glycine/sarcosine/betaine reductase complex component C subunit alpha [Clostridium polynesiense]|uniref:glycine/sarcosine/betaine reductase complex component C subunit alpha n=1 Tax=Clostridium polynesiense TaxID=1325933 RepID=UPI00058EA0B8|nr:glycine/sarcosine/betaine reductase complex component C subunit alpha [Clostridium polynesiense]
MEKDVLQKVIGEVFNEIADNIKDGSYGKKTKIGLTILGSEHGVDVMVKAAEIAKARYPQIDIILIGPRVTEDFTVVEASDAEEGHKKMVELLNSGEIDGCVTQHFEFPIGTSTMGKVVTPAKGNEMIIASTTGTSAINRVEAMVLNSIGGLAVAKANGIKSPKLGILNIEGARKVEIILNELKENGYEIEFSSSQRADGGAVMRGNDLLMGTPDVMVCDSLTGNLLIKVFSSFSTGGNYETTGAGYGPGVGDGYDKVINIVSRASGAPLIAEAIKFCSESAKNNLPALVKKEFEAAKSAGLSSVLEKHLKPKAEVKEEEVKMPPKKVVTYSIAGIDILELENACRTLWKEDIYSESGMGCTGPIILVPEEDGKKAEDILVKSGYKA